MDDSSGDKLSGPENREHHGCRCGAQPKVVHKMMEPTRGLTVRMFECQCGERSWTEHKD